MFDEVYNYSWVATYETCILSRFIPTLTACMMYLGLNLVEVLENNYVTFVHVCMYVATQLQLHAQYKQTRAVSIQYVMVTHMGCA